MNFQDFTDVFSLLVDTTKDEPLFTYFNDSVVHPLVVCSLDSGLTSLYIWIFTLHSKFCQSECIYRCTQILFILSILQSLEYHYFFKKSSNIKLGEVSLNSANSTILNLFYQSIERANNYLQKIKFYQYLQIKIS